MKRIAMFVLKTICLYSTIVQAADLPSMRSQVQAEFVFEARVTVGKPLVIGQSSLGMRRIVPITGGTFEGPGIRGRVIPGGADWQVVRSDGVIDIHAKYTLETDDGVLIMVENRGLRHAAPEVMERLSSGHFVPRNEYYFRTLGQFEAPLGSKYEWLNRAVFVGVAERLPAAAVIRFHRID